MHENAGGDGSAGDECGHIGSRERHPDGGVMTQERERSEPDGDCRPSCPAVDAIRDATRECNVCSPILQHARQTRRDFGIQAVWTPVPYRCGMVRNLPFIGKSAFSGMLADLRGASRLCRQAHKRLRTEAGPTRCPDSIRAYRTAPSDDGSSIILNDTENAPRFDHHRFRRQPCRRCEKHRDERAMRCFPEVPFNEKGESHEQISHTSIRFRHRRVGGDPGLSLRGASAAPSSTRTASRTACSMWS
jgi:hypothetical protein